jgi:hypothetical protein
MIWDVNVDAPRGHVGESTMSLVVVACLDRSRPLESGPETFDVTFDSRQRGPHEHLPG